MGTVEKLAFYLLKKVDKAVRHYDLIKDGDRIVVTVEKDPPQAKVNLFQIVQRYTRGKGVWSSARGYALSSGMRTPPSQKGASQLIGWFQRMPLIGTRRSAHRTSFVFAGSRDLRTHRRTAHWSHRSRNLC